MLGFFLYGPRHVYSVNVLLREFNAWQLSSNSLWSKCFRSLMASLCLTYFYANVLHCMLCVATNLCQKFVDRTSHIGYLHFCTDWKLTPTKDNCFSSLCWYPVARPSPAFAGAELCCQVEIITQRSSCYYFVLSFYMLCYLSRSLTILGSQKWQYFFENIWICRFGRWCGTKQKLSVLPKKHKAFLTSSLFPHSTVPHLHARDL